MSQTELKRGLRRVLEQTRTLAPELAVILVNNVRNETIVRNDYDDYSVAASFLHDFEIDDIIRALRSFRIHVIHFCDEVEFLRWALTGGYAAVSRRRKLVYSSAVNGSGPGRKSLIPAFCALERIATVNSNAYASALCRHKFHWNKLLVSFGISVPRSWLCDSEAGWFMGDEPPSGLRVIGKATFEGGSIGLEGDTIGPYSDSLRDRFADLGRKLRQPITVQEFISGSEVEVPVVHHSAENRVLDPVAISNADGSSLENAVLTYGAMWHDDCRFADTDLSDSTLAVISSVTKTIVNAIPLAGFSRIDFRVDPQRGPFVIDVASTPHLTRRSSFAFRFAQLGFSYEEMLLLLFGTAADELSWGHSSIQNCNSESSTERP